MKIQWDTKLQKYEADSTKKNVVILHIVATVYLETPYEWNQYKVDP